MDVLHVLAPAPACTDLVTGSKLVGGYTLQCWAHEGLGSNQHLSGERPSN